jgi:hypothetical protein
MQETLSILVPAYNEAATIETALRRLWAVELPLPYEIIVVDDGSTDASVNIVGGLQEESPVSMKLIQHARNRGKTAAIRTGLEYAFNTLTLIYDADLEYDPADIPALIAPILDGRADAVYGSRFQSPQRRVLFFWHTLGNRLVTMMANMFANLNLTDMETCFKLIRTDILKEMRFRSERFGYEPEVTVKLGRLGHRIYEIPIRYSGRSYDEGKKIKWWDAVRAAGTIIRAGVFESPVSDPDAATRYAMQGLGSYYGSILGRVREHVGNTVMASCSGAGGLVHHLLQKQRVLLTEQDPGLVAMLRTRFSHRPNLSVQQWSLAQGPYEGLVERFQTVLCFSALDCLDEDVAGLRSLTVHLEPGGSAILLLPAHPGLYGTLDQNIGRKRRYSRQSARELVEAAGLELISLREIDGIGAVGWWLATKIFRTKQMRPSQVRLFRLALPLFRLERLIPPAFGLSYLIVARKP